MLGSCTAEVKETDCDEPIRVTADEFRDIPYEARCRDGQGYVFEGDFSFAEDDQFSESYSCICELEGSFEIIISTLESLRGLESLRYIRGDLTISGNDLIESLEGLNGLERVTGRVSIRGNDSLLTLSGLERLKEVEDTLSINRNESLESMAGLDSLEFIGAELLIDFNDSLKSLSGLEELAYIKSGLSVHFNSQLKDLAGLDSLEVLDGNYGGSLAVVSNERLESLTGLDSLVHLGGTATVRDNPSLRDISSLQRVSHVGAYGFTVGDNKVLPTCSVVKLLYGQIGIRNIVSGVSVYGNSPDCPLK